MASDKGQLVPLLRVNISSKIIVITSSFATPTAPRPEEERKGNYHNNNNNKNSTHTGTNHNRIREGRVSWCGCRNLSRSTSTTARSTA